MPCRGCETSDVSDHSPTDTNDYIIASDAHFGKLLTQTLYRQQRLRIFSLGDGDNL